MATSCRPPSCWASARPRSTASSRSTASPTRFGKNELAGLKKEPSAPIVQIRDKSKVIRSVRNSILGGPKEPPAAPEPYRHAQKELEMSILIVTGIEGARNCAAV